VITLLYTTVSSLEDAQELARRLLEGKLAACVNISSPLSSLYLWEGKIEEGAEYSLLIKTTSAKGHVLKEWLVANHPYDVPALLMWEAETTDAFEAYVALESKRSEVS